MCSTFISAISFRQIGPTSKWAKKYPRIGNCVDAVASIVQKLRSQTDAELETRFDVIRDRFVTGVSRAEIDRIIAMMQTSPYVSGRDEWIEAQDFFYTHEGRQYRTRVNYGSLTMQVVPHTIEKRLLGMQDIVIIDSAQRSVPWKRRRASAQGGHGLLKHVFRALVPRPQSGLFTKHLMSSRAFFPLTASLRIANDCIDIESNLAKVEHCIAVNR